MRKENDNGIINDNDVYTQWQRQLTKTAKNFQASQPSNRCAFDDVALVAWGLFNSEWDLTDCELRCLEVIFFFLEFFSFVVLVEIRVESVSSVKRWTIIQIFRKIPLKLDATHRKGETHFSFSVVFTSCLFFLVLYMYR